jgi:GGDEF domain-containing protein
MVDIDGMAALNKDLGWRRGDAAIFTVKSLLRTRTPDGDIWRIWRGDKFLANLERSDANLQWLSDLPALTLRRAKVPVTVCTLVLRSPTAADLGLLAECMAGRSYLHDTRAA